MHSSKKQKLSRRHSQRKGKAQREHVKPWSIGQRIVVEVDAPMSKNKRKHRRVRQTATIKDYDVQAKTTHIWFETEQHHFENVDLETLQDWDVDPLALPLHEHLPFVPDNEWVPTEWKMGQRVMVRFHGDFGRGLKYAAYIDGYDPASRRYHVDYGDTTEWLWADPLRVSSFHKKCEPYLEQKRQSFMQKGIQQVPPPWEPELYGLDETFTVRSAELESIREAHLKVNAKTKNKKHYCEECDRYFKSGSALGGHRSRLHSKKRLENEQVQYNTPTTRSKSNSHDEDEEKQRTESRSPPKDVLSALLAKRKRGTLSSKRAPRQHSTADHQTKEDVTSASSDSTIENQTEREAQGQNGDEDSDIDASDSSMSTSKREGPFQKHLNLVNIRPSDIPFFNVHQMREANHEKIQTPYPRRAIIAGNEWIRHHSADERKYFWARADAQDSSRGREWDPWRKNGLKAPWMKVQQSWCRFTDPKKRRPYYYNYETQQSTFSRPDGFESEQDIEYDSAEENR